MLALLLLAATTTASNNPSAWTAYKPEVRKAVLAHYGPKTPIDSILIKSNYALVHSSSFHIVLVRSDGSWKIVCNLQGQAASANALESRCGVPAPIAGQMAAEEPANLLAGHGEFSAAMNAEQNVFTAATGPERMSESLRVQKLRLLSEQMRLQQITREQAIQQWNQLQYSWALP